MTKENDWINNLKVGDSIFIHKYSSYSRNAKNCVEVISKIGRKYITTTKNRVIEIATGHERSKVTGSLIAKIYTNEGEYLKEIELNRKHSESIELLKSTKTRECIEAVYAILTGGKSGWISVDDGLPEQGAYVLVCNGRCIVVAKLVGDIWSIPNYLSLSGLTVASGVTHWQPLPPRPQD